jgi:hypothetical protein
MELFLTAPTPSSIPPPALTSSTNNSAPAQTTLPTEGYKPSPKKLAATPHPSQGNLPHITTGTETMRYLLCSINEKPQQCSKDLKPLTPNLADLGLAIQDLNTRTFFTSSCGIEMFLFNYHKFTDWSETDATVMHYFVVIDISTALSLRYYLRLRLSA